MDDRSGGANADGAKRALYVERSLYVFYVEL